MLFLDLKSRPTTKRKTNKQQKYKTRQDPSTIIKGKSIYCQSCGKESKKLFKIEMPIEKIKLTNKLVMCADCFRKQVI